MFDQEPTRSHVP
uniref:Uncharacterized protein n=1 Tax=Arundo donax TaxID=35708 RepID=A0A0A9AKK8_ARUDO